MARMSRGRAGFDLVFYWVGECLVDLKKSAKRCLSVFLSVMRGGGMEICENGM